MNKIKKIMAAVFVITSIASASVNSSDGNTDGTKIVTTYLAGSSFKEIVESGKEMKCNFGGNWSVSWNAKKDVFLPETVFANGSYDENIILIYRAFIDDFNRNSKVKDGDINRKYYGALNVVIKIDTKKDACSLSVEDKGY
ncbi:hypothetical protein [Pectobacterium versatile]|uniref:hypothetical protein n=1 Tax=Pectobacterium versatile TaxID=2488639 RepID=UPI001F468C28|nr:hypothetical protein [Pectobacterium versatile]